MKKKSFNILCVLLMSIFLTACKGKVERVEPNDISKDDAQEETFNGYTKEELEERALPEDVFDEEDSNNNSQDSEELTEEDVESALEEITENYGDGGAIILPEDVWE